MIKSGRYKGTKLSHAHNNRASGYSGKGQTDLAIADENQAIKLDPKNAPHALADYAQAIRLSPQYTLALLNRGNTYAATTDYDHAIADYTTNIQINPKDSGGYFPLGRTNLYAGALAKALADLDQASEIDPKNGYVALWLDIATRRSKLPSRLATATTQLDITKWPAPVIRLYLD
jgi:tetratricopeptide (TPR) repeat protein